MRHPDFDYGHGALMEAWRARAEIRRVALGEHDEFGSADLRMDARDRIAPYMRRVSAMPDPARNHDPGVLVVAPLPLGILGGRFKPDLSPCIWAIENYACGFACVLAAEPGHEWRRLIQEWDSEIPRLPVQPHRVECFRADFLLWDNNPTRWAAKRAPGDLLEMELCAAAQAEGLLFEVIIPEPADNWRSIGSILNGMKPKPGGGCDDAGRI